MNRVGRPRGLVNVAPAWMYRDPFEIIERLLQVKPRVQTSAHVSKPVRRDRYYTMARRVEIRRATRKAMRGDR